jgi:CHASE2 domain-containing sensor protein
LPIIVFFLLFTALACIAMAWLPEIALIPAIAWGGILIVSALYLEEKKILLLFLFNLTILLFMAGAHQLLYYLAFFGIAALIMSLLTSRKADYYQIQKVGISADLCGR